MHYCGLYLFLSLFFSHPAQPRQSELVDLDINTQQVKRIPQQLHYLRQQQHEDALMYHQMVSRFPLQANPLDNVYSQGYGYQSATMHAS